MRGCSCGDLGSSQLQRRRPTPAPPFLRPLPQAEPQASGRRAEDGQPAVQREPVAFPVGRQRMGVTPAERRQQAAKRSTRGPLGLGAQPGRCTYARLCRGFPRRARGRGDRRGRGLAASRGGAASSLPAKCHAGAVRRRSCQPGSVATPTWASWLGPPPLVLGKAKARVTTGRSDGAQLGRNQDLPTAPEIMEGEGVDTGRGRRQELEARAFSWAS
jgi:hypothetical protein